MDSCLRVRAYYPSTPMEHKSKPVSERPIASNTPNKPLEKVLDLYQYPKRDNMCVQCGQQLPWCVCHLNEYQ